MNYFEQLLQQDKQKEIDTNLFSGAKNSNNELYSDLYKPSPDIIGQGGFGILRPTRRICDKNKDFVTKVIAKENLLGWQTKGESLLEAEILLQVNHESIVRSLDVFSNNDYYHLILELCHGKTLFEVIEDQTRLIEDTARVIFSQVRAG